MVNFIDKTSSFAGTPLNRSHLMAMQGFEQCDVVFSDDGNTITETYTLDDGVTTETLVTSFHNEEAEPYVTETFTGSNGTIITKTTTFKSNGTIETRLS